MRLTSALWVLAISADGALGQGLQKELLKPVNVEQSNLVQWLITAVFVVAALVVAFKPAKRSKLE